MRIFPALVLSVAATAATVVCSVALAGDQASGSTPTGLKGFVLRANEPVTHGFSQTPSFSWTPVRGARSYQIQLAKSATFSDQSVFWSGTSKTPTLASPLALPWMTGFPYAGYARVRAVTGSGASNWSAPFGFNIRWPSLPQQLPDLPGLSRWTQVPGATGYQVWFVGQKTGVRVRTDSVDHRDFYDLNGTPTGPIRWRVRAERILFGSLPTGVPRASYGPWSPIYTSNDAALGAGRLATTASVTSGATSTAVKPLSHDITPALSYSGYAPGTLFRTYISTDADCVNIVFVGTAVTSPAFAPRLTGAETSARKFSKNFMADGTEITPNEYLSASSVDTGSKDAAADGATAPATSSSGTAAQPEDPLVDLWESGWPTGRYYWTVVPVAFQTDPNAGSDPAAGPASGIARDIELPQDACQSGRVQTFGEATAPVVSAVGSPFASGLATNGRLIAAVSATPTFYGSPLVAWKPAGIATSYQVEWSKSQYPWKKAGSASTTATAASLPLKPGTWWYRVRGVADFLPGTAKLMTWSTPLRIQVAAPKFTVAR
jgi:hypothetical protein